MVSYEYRTITIRGESQTIKEFVAAFATPFGICDTVEQAIQACKSRDMDPELNIKPVVLAVGETTYEVL